MLSWLWQKKSDGNRPSSSHKPVSIPSSATAQQDVQDMADASSQTPHLTPQFCFNERALRDFLRLSRSSLDDSISTHLNSLLTPSSSSPFHPLSVSQKRPTPNPNPSRTLPARTCNTFLTTQLFPHWSQRDAVLTYCSLIATSPDPDDPDLSLRTIEAAKQSLRKVDERLDPYSGRWSPREARTERLAQVLRNEGLVERIVRERVWGVVGAKCGDGVVGDIGGGKGWEEEYEKWKKVGER